MPALPARVRGTSGYLVPKPEQQLVTAASFGSQKWAHWQGTGEIVRVSLGRDGLDIDGLDDDRLVDAAVAELGTHLDIDVQPTATRITRWPHSFPQYRPGHLTGWPPSTRRRHGGCSSQGRPIAGSVSRRASPTPNEPPPPSSPTSEREALAPIWAASGSLVDSRTPTSSQRPKVVAAATRRCSSSSRPSSAHRPVPSPAVRHVRSGIAAAAAAIVLAGVGATAATAATPLPPRRRRDHDHDAAAASRAARRPGRQRTRAADVPRSHPDPGDRGRLPVARGHPDQHAGLRSRPLAGNGDARPARQRRRRRAPHQPQRRLPPPRRAAARRPGDLRPRCIRGLRARRRGSGLGSDPGPVHRPVRLRRPLRGDRHAGRDVGRHPGLPPLGDAVRLPPARVGRRTHRRVPRSRRSGDARPRRPAPADDDDIDGRRPLDDAPAGARRPRRRTSRRLFAAAMGLVAAGVRRGRPVRAGARQLPVAVANAPASPSCSPSPGWPPEWRGCGSSPRPATSLPAPCSPCSTRSPQSPRRSAGGARSVGRSPTRSSRHCASRGRSVGCRSPAWGSPRRPVRSPESSASVESSCSPGSCSRAASPSACWSRRLAGATADVRLAVAGLLAAAAVTAVSAVAPRGHGTGVFLDVAAVQGGGEQGTRADDVPSAVVTQRHVEATRSIEPGRRARPRAVAGERRRRHRLRRQPRARRHRRRGGAPRSSDLGRRHRGRARRATTGSPTPR